MIPIPSNIISSIDNGVNDAKFDTVFENIYFNPLKLNKFSIVIIVDSNELLLVFTVL